MIARIVIFLLLNFSALAIGGIFSSKGVPSDWYQGLEKAPWTPPGWVFGFAWTAIMICFSIYMAYVWPGVENKMSLIGLYLAQWLLNVAWNPSFFYYHQVGPALLIISLLTVVIACMLILYWGELAYRSALILPYLVWLVIATSLNGYIYLKN